MQSGQEIYKKVGSAGRSHEQAEKILSRPCNSRPVSIGCTSDALAPWRQQFPEIQPQADLMMTMGASSPSRLQHARVRDVRDRVAGHVHDTAAFQRERVGHEFFLRAGRHGSATAPSRCCKCGCGRAGLQPVHQRGRERQRRQQGHDDPWIPSVRPRWRVQHFARNVAKRCDQYK